MISQIRNSLFVKALWGLMGLYLLNISVDPADPFPDHIPEDLSFNDQESIIEIFFEKILGYENALEEYDDHDREDHNNKNNVKLDFIDSLFDINDASVLIETRKQILPHFDSRLNNGFYRIDIPPPKV